MISTNDVDLLTSEPGRKLLVNNGKLNKKDDFEASRRCKTKKQAVFKLDKENIESSSTANFRDDGYLSLAKCEAKSSKPLLLMPTNSWPLRRKITEKELKEFGEKLDSGSTSLLETTRNHGHNSKQSVSSQSGTLLIEQEIETVLGPDHENYNIEKCIDYCTCMFCVKSACYMIDDDQDDTGDPHYDPCYCSGPNRGCITRWSLLGLISCFMPCLMCYPLARGCLNRHNRCKNKKYSKNKSKSNRYKIKFSKSKQPQVS